MLERLISAFYYRLYLLILLLTGIFLHVALKILSELPTKTKPRGVLALPYYPENWPGCMERFSNWKPYFEASGVVYDLHYASDKDEYLSYLGFVNRPGMKFLSNLKFLIRRARAIVGIRHYEVIYVQREVIPFFDTGRPTMDRILIKNHTNVVYDFYDADYASTPVVTHYILSNARAITVASRPLEQYALKFNSKVLFTRLCLPLVEISPKPLNPGLIRIGWMGSPTNGQNLVRLQSVLEKVAKEFEQVVFSFVCRDRLNLHLDHIEWYEPDAPGFDLNKWLEGVDIGIVPYVDHTEQAIAKTAMKSLQFWNASVALVCSPWGMSDQIRDGENCLVGVKEEDWYRNLKNLIIHKASRVNIGINGRNALEQYHGYGSNFEALKSFLLE